MIVFDYSDIKARMERRPLPMRPAAVEAAPSKLQMAPGCKIYIGKEDASETGEWYPVGLFGFR